MVFLLYLDIAVICTYLRRYQTTRFLLTIACDLHRGESGGILHNRVQSDGILPYRIHDKSNNLLLIIILISSIGH